MLSLASFSLGLNLGATPTRAGDVRMAVDVRAVARGR